MTGYASPGPWRIETAPGPLRYWWVVSPGGNVVANVFNREDAEAIVAHRNMSPVECYDDEEWEITFTPDTDDDDPFST